MTIEAGGYLALEMSVKCVDGLDEAVERINRYGTGHSEAIVAEDEAACERFLREVDAAAVYANASTRFTDGGGSAWEPRSVSPRRSCMPAGRSLPKR